MEMLTGYAASHQHPFNVFVHMIGIPTIMFGVLIPLTWAGTEIAGVAVNLAHLVVFCFFLFYLTLDKLFALAFLALAFLLAYFAGIVGAQPMAVSGTVAAAAFFGGYVAQFVGHAVEKSMPVLVRHPVQANLAAPFFQIVEMFKILGLRDELFEAVQQEIESRRTAEAGLS
jgi:uncharacterized membrane protein YGL010W